MSLPVDIDIANPDPSAAPTTFGEFVALLRTLITAVVSGNYIPYVTGSATPSVTDQDKIWYRTDVDGRPIGAHTYYGGSWRRSATHRANEIVMYRGIPGVDFDSTGKGVVGGEWDGFAVCNGNNGTVDMSDKFVVASHMTDWAIGYTGGQHSTTVSGATTQQGGVNAITLTDDNTFRPAVPALVVGRWQADGNSAVVGGGMYGLGTGATLTLADAGNAAPDAIPTLPPYIALGFAQWIGY